MERELGDLCFQEKLELKTSRSSHDDKKLSPRQSGEISPRNKLVNGVKSLRVKISGKVNRSRNRSTSPPMSRMRLVLPNVFISSLPYNGEADRLRFYHELEENNIKVLICLVEDVELRKADCSDYLNQVQQLGIDIIRCQVRDMTTPQINDLLITIKHGSFAYGRNQPLAFQCYEGLGRSATFLACMLVTLGWTSLEAVKQIRQAEPKSFLTIDQLRMPDVIAQALPETKICESTPPVVTRKTVSRRSTKSMGQLQSRSVPKRVYARAP